MFLYIIESDQILDLVKDNWSFLLYITHKYLKQPIFYFPQISKLCIEATAYRLSSSF